MKNIKIFAIALLVVASYTNQSFAQVAAAKNGPTDFKYDMKKNVKCRVIPTETGCTIVFDNVISTGSVAGISGGVVAGKKGYDYYKNMSAFSVSSADNSVSIVSPRDPASGLPTGKRMHKPMGITNELNKKSKESRILVTTTELKDSRDFSIGEPGVQKAPTTGTGMGAGKATFKEFTVTKRCDGKTTKISCPDGECDIPLDDCPNGTCDLVCSWSWGLSQQGTSMNSSGSAGFSLEIQEGVCTAMAIKEKPKMTQHK